jgi:hypothetical protein
MAESWPNQHAKLKSKTVVIDVNLRLKQQLPQKTKTLTGQ